MELVQALRSRRLAALIIILISDVFFINLSPPTFAVPPNFQDTVVWSDLTLPTAVRFAADGKVFVAEKSGIIKVYDSLDDPTPTVFADLRGEVLDFLDSGLLGLAVDPGFPARPYVYAFYSADAPLGVAPPFYHDTCNSENCPNFSRLLRLTANASGTSAISQQVIRDGWCQMTPLHSVGDLVFGSDGYLYVTHGEGGSPYFVDYGQTNTCGDPPFEGGSLRAQDIRTSGDPVAYGGALIRINPDTGAAAPGNPLAGGSIVDDDPIVAMGLRNPFRFAIDRLTGRVWIGDVGWGASEEVNTVASPFTTVPNFGWPCYEGNSRQTGFESANVPICAGVYSSLVGLAPYYSYSHAGTNAAVTGVALYRGSNFPAAYDGALFLADYSRDWIKVMSRGANGLPDPATLTDFVPSANAVVDLQVGPGGELFYVSIFGGTIRKIAYISDNTPPVASMTADVTAGPLPLTVHFNASMSADPDPGDTISLGWDLNGDGVFNDAAGPTATFTYTSLAAVSAKVRVTDSHGAIDTAIVVIVAGASAPVPSLTAPTAVTTYRVGNMIAFAGSAFDPDTTLSMPATSLSWRVLLNHCAVGNPTDCHEHFLQQFSGVSGGMIQAPDHEYPSFLRFELTATKPPSGALPALAATTSRSIYPETTTVTLDSVPSGLQVSIYGTTATTPVTRTVIVNAQTTVTAPTPQALGGAAYEFSSWSDGGAQTHLITAAASPLMLTATYSPTGMPLQSVWNSWDVAMQSTTPQALVTAPLTGTTATVEFYESTNDLGVLKGGLFSTFNPGADPHTFNNVEQYWAPGSGGVYPYAGKSRVNRGADVGETSTPMPLGVRDLQLHPPSNAHNAVAAFRVPSDGSYSISNLGVRRVSNLGGPVTFRVFNAQQVQIGTLQATANQAWVTMPTTLTIANLTAGSYLYFAVDRAGDYFYDATEISWTVTLNSSGPPPPLPSCTLTALPTTVDAGMTTTLTWTAANATSVSIDRGIGAVSPVAGGMVMAIPAGTTLYTATASGPGGSATCETTVTMNSSPATTSVWNSWDVVTQSGTPQGLVTAAETGAMAIVEFYESTNNGGVTRGTLFNVFNAGIDPHTFNNLEQYWGPGTGGVYPYAGKSSVNRGADAGETNTPMPLAVRDLQLHPPSNAHNTVAAFRVPSDGTYTITNLGVRRVSNLGGPVGFHVFSGQQVEISMLQATANQAWMTSPATYSLTNLTAGSYLYFAVDNAGEYGWDAAEIAWSVTLNGGTPPPPMPSCTLTAFPTTVSAGAPTTLTWTSTNATSISIDHGVGALTPAAGGMVMSVPAGVTLYAATATGPGGSAMCNTTVTVTADPGTPSVWNSWDVVTQSGTPQGQVTASATGNVATVEFYESINDGGVLKSGLFSTFTAGTQPQSFNNLERYWAMGTGNAYPYAGKSTVNRGADVGETSVPMPLAVRDLQLHPPNNQHLVVAAFRAPIDATYTIANLGVRRVSNLGGAAGLHVFNPQQVEIATLPATANRAWVTSPTTYTVANVTAGTYLYFAVDRAGDYAYDATEIAWTITATVGGPAAPSCTLSATPGSITQGMSTALAWTSMNASSLSIDQGVGVVTPVADGSVTASPTTTTLYTATVTGPAGTAGCSTTVTVTADPGTSSAWNSWDVVTQIGTPQGQVTASATGSVATIEFYESTNDGGVVRSGLFSAFNAGNQPQAFNNLERYWAMGTGNVYPYAGKSTVNRGADVGEANAPMPLAVRDLQLHPPNNLHLVVAAFRVPSDGTYTITNLGVRRVSNLGGPAALRVFNGQQVEIATLQATVSRAWVTSAATYNLPNLTAGTYLYFAVDRAGDYAYDATEVAWTITRTGS